MGPVVLSRLKSCIFLIFWIPAHPIRLPYACSMYYMPFKPIFPIQKYLPKVQPTCINRPTIDLCTYATSSYIYTIKTRPLVYSEDLFKLHFPYIFLTSYIFSTHKRIKDTSQSFEIFLPGRGFHEHQKCNFLGPWCFSAQVCRTKRAHAENAFYSLTGLFSLVCILSALPRLLHQPSGWCRRQTGRRGRA